MGNGFSRFAVVSPLAGQTAAAHISLACDAGVDDASLPFQPGAGAMGFHVAGCPKPTSCDGAL